MYSITALAAILALAMPSTLASPDATKNFPITTGCKQFPGYQAGSNVTNNFWLQLVQSKAPVNTVELSPLNYFDADKGRYVVPGEDLAKYLVRCNQGNASSNGGVPFLEQDTGTGSFVPIQIFAPATGFDANADNAQLVFGAASNVTQLARPFGHDASASSGIFLGGADNSTKFAVRLEFFAGADIDRNFYSLRYVPTGGKTASNEFTGYVKVLSF